MATKFIVRNRALHQFRLTDEKAQDLIDKAYKRPPLMNMEFSLIGKLSSSNQKIESVIKRLGGKLVAGIHEKLAAVISNEDEIQKMGPKMTLAKKCDIQVVSEDFLTSIEKMDPCRYIICRSISDWGGNVSF